MILKNKKASVLTLAILLIVIMAALIAAASGVVINFISFTQRYERAGELSALAETGMQRAIGIIQSGIPVIDDTYPEHTEKLTGMGSEDINITIVYNDLADYTVTSTAANSSITAVYKNNKIISWR